MQVSVETTEGLGRRMTVQVPAEQVEEKVDQRLRSLRGNVRMDGFRPGKVPLKVVRKRYGPQVRGEVLSELVQSTYSEALREKELRPAGNPEIEPKQTEEGKDLEYQATFEVLPSFEVTGLDQIKVERPQVEITDADVDEVLERLRKQQAEYNEVDRASQEGDRVVIDFKGTVDGEEFSGNEGNDVPVVLGAGQMPPAFEEGLTGVKAGDETTIEHTFPEEFPDSEVAGKAGQFAVTVKTVEAPEYPEIDDAFAEKVGVKEGGVEKLREAIKTNLERERDQTVASRVKHQVMDQLLDITDIELPKVLVDAEIDQLRQQEQSRQQQSGQEEPDDLPAALFEENARRRVALGLIVNELVRSNDIKLDRDRVMQSLQEMAAGYEQPEEVLRYYAQNRQLMEGVEVAVLEDQVVDYVVQQAQVEDKPMSLQELMSPQQPEAESAEGESKQDETKE
ncbi:trigger factor [Alkalilimnicola ehrlichii MLHE-1]|uniref:Trigger factor n=1 Tax=Alkalilimnicola ehrlichii (strain ATCC BAA-1101 / DSM 17681 / MLHE-1) TaxID=187272 RepID=TIG_ALKEH|nr:trigger factor [Alkalilimnicola ehrlichii]Q0A6A6.1 RecName: Full=Trigger factor; Short=TF; AltName: Full=PPIase [Alkalilimnicola ehrlichii MLHE-1]ABI57631.1 trigger factor [Alkalilimnicola ehrlichii MLHE-1]